MKAVSGASVPALHVILLASDNVSVPGVQIGKHAEAAGTISAPSPHVLSPITIGNVHGMGVHVKAEAGASEPSLHVIPLASDNVLGPEVQVGTHAGATYAIPAPSPHEFAPTTIGNVHGRGVHVKAVALRAKANTARRTCTSGRRATDCRICLQRRV